MTRVGGTRGNAGQPPTTIRPVPERLEWVAGASTLPNDRRQPGLTKHSMSPMTSTSKVAISTSRSDRGNARFGRSDMCFGPSDSAGVLVLGPDNCKSWYCFMARTRASARHDERPGQKLCNLCDERERAA